MCGIAGCINYKNPIDAEKFNKMVDIVTHRGPDSRGVFIENNIALGHRRLAIIDLSEDGHQPFLYHNRYVLVFNGEIYNYRELREELEQKGITFTTKTDTEVLIAAYDYWRDECVQHFNGMWAFAIYDKDNQEIFCSRDRFGIKPFYYTNQEEKFLFASEIKQFFEILDNAPKANKDTLIQYLVRGESDYSEETMFADIYELRGGYNLVYNLKTHTFKKWRYHDLNGVSESMDDYAKAKVKFRDAFRNSVNLRLRADVPVGYCLSGGLDSSAIVSMADLIVKENGNNTEQYSISSCFEDKRYDEQEYIDEVIRCTSVKPHKVFPSEENLFEKLDDIIWHMDEPFGSTSIYAQWNVFEGAKKNNLKVMLDGQGADEQLAGYTVFYKVRFSTLLRNRQFRKFYKEWKTYKELRAKTEKHVSTRDLLLSTMASVVFPDEKRGWLKKIYYLLPANRGPFSYKVICDAIDGKKDKPVRDSREYIRMSIYDSMSKLLHYEDRNSMAHSIESRVPFLDYKLVELIYSLPFEYKIRDGRTKAILRDGLQGILPDKIRNRYSKLGFVTPEDQWINSNYDKYSREVGIAAKKLSKLLDEEKVVLWFQSNKGKIKRKDFTAWRLICASHWIDVFNVEL